MHIRKLVLSDIPALLAMGMSEEGFRVSEGTPAFWSEQALERWIGEGDDVLLGAEIEGKLAGFVLTAFHRPTGKVTWENLVVLPEYRRSRIGEALADEMRIRLRDKGATYICFLVKTNNADSISYFEKIGFNKGHNFVWFDESL